MIKIKTIILIIGLLFTSSLAGAITSLQNGTWGIEVDAQIQSNIPIVLLNGSGTWGIEVNAQPVYIPGIVKTLSNGTWGIEVNLGTTIIIDVSPDVWDADNPYVDSSVMNNFTFYQNGSATIDVKVGFNDTNYSYVNYSTWINDGHDQYTANYTIDTWASETNIEPKSGGQPVTVLKNSLGSNSNFVFGIRLYMPKTVTYANLREDFQIMFNASSV